MPRHALAPALALLFVLPLPAGAAGPRMPTEGADLGVEAARKASAARPGDAAAQLALARALMRARRAGRVCEFDAYRSTVNEALASAVRLSPSLLPAIRSDGSFLELRDTVAFQRLMGLSPERPGDAATLLERVQYFGPASGVLGSALALDFLPGGRVKLVERVLSDDGMRVRQTAHPGAYTLKGTSLTITLGAPLGGERRFTGSLAADGTLTLSALGVFTDDLSECEA